MSFTRKKLDLTFQLGTGVFGETGTNTVTVSGLRASAEIDAAGGVMMSQLNLQVWGLPQSTLNQLTALTNKTMISRNNSVIVQAGDDETGMTTIYEGSISSGWAQLTPPDSCLTVTAHSGLIHKLAPVPPRSYAGAADVATIMSSLALQMGYALENNGVSVILSTPYLHGTALDQAHTVAEHANIDMGVDRNTLFICNKGQSRNGTPALISPNTGMVGFPCFTATGVEVAVLFNPTISINGAVTVQSGFTPANGTWKVVSVSHSLHSETPNGDWFTHLQLAEPYSNVIAAR